MSFNVEGRPVSRRVTRRRMLPILLSPVAFLLKGEAPAALSGRQIMDEVSRRQTRPREFARERMTLLSGNEAEAVRTVRRYIRRTDAGPYRYLIVYDSPPGIAGTAALTWQVKDGPDDQWLYLPSLDRLTRIIGGAKRKSFMGTDFAFEDLSVEQQEDYRYQRLPDAVFDGITHFVVRAEPVSADLRASTSYSSRKLYVQQSIFMIKRVEYFARDTGVLMKTLSVLKAKRLDQDTWRAAEHIMTNHLEDHSTHVEMLETRFDDASVPPDVFEQRYLTSHAHMR